MDQRLHDHILILEERIQGIVDRLTDPHLGERERARCGAELCVAETALWHYRLAYGLEQGSGWRDGSSQD